MATDGHTGVGKKSVENPSVLPAYYNKQQVECAVELQFQQVTLDEDEQPSDCWVMSLFTLILCFWPLGLAALIMSSKVRDAWRQGDSTGAKRASSYVTALNVIGIVVGILMYIAAIVIVVVFVPISSWCTSDDHSHNGSCG